MADAKLTKIGINDAVAKEEAAKVVEAPAANPAIAPNVSERRVVGRYEVPTPSGQIIVVENL